jgi:hypothetical protein
MGEAYCRRINCRQAMEETYHTDSFRNLSITSNLKFADAVAVKKYTYVGGE